MNKHAYSEYRLKLKISHREHIFQYVRDWQIIIPIIDFELINNRDNNLSIPNTVFMTVSAMLQSHVINTQSIQIPPLKDSRKNMKIK